METIKKIISGEEKFKILAIVGPCSANDPDAVYRYFYELDKQTRDIRDVIHIVGRVYTAKPRTIASTQTYQGLIAMPDGPDKPINYEKGMEMAKSLMSKIANNLPSIPIADEMLYVENWDEFNSYLSYSAIGARSTEDQIHRLMASYVKEPVGIKNPTDGNIASMYNGVLTASNPQEFMMGGKVRKSEGNPYAHPILRGGVNGPNYHYEDLIKCYEHAKKVGMESRGVIVDCSHANSGKDWRLQRKIAKEVLYNKFNSTRLLHFIRGVMIESYIKDGACEGPYEYGKSITDACLGLDRTVKLLHDLADSMRDPVHIQMLKEEIPVHD